MHHKVEIISLKKNEVIYKKKHKKYNTITTICLMLSVLVVLVASGKLYLNSYDSNAIISSLNPIYSPYVETGNMIFTDSDYDLVSKELNFVAPVNFKDYEIFENEIVFEVLGDNVIKAIEDGVVVEINSTNNDVKFIKILHCDNYVSVYEGIDVCGVSVGQKIDKSARIGTAKASEIKLSLYKDNNALLVDNIFDNQIVCK